MRPFLLLCLALSILAGTACNSQKNPKFQINQAFRLNIGQTAVWQDDPRIQIRFDSVTEDSRCPQGIQCVQAGRAIMAITLIQNDKSQNTALVMGDPKGTNYSNQAQFGDFTVLLLQILPHPTASQKVLPERYFMEIEVLQDE